MEGLDEGGSTMAVCVAPEDSEYWVDAAPFRAQLRYLMSSTSRSAEEVAEAAGISERLAHRLLYGRNGRALRRISPECGRRLIQLSVSQLRQRPGREAAA
jgi:hypothetical protein